MFEVKLELNGFILEGTVREIFRLPQATTPSAFNYNIQQLYICDISHGGRLLKYQLEHSEMCCVVKHNTYDVGVVHGVAHLTNGSIIFTDSIKRNVKQMYPDGSIHIYMYAGNGLEARAYWPIERASFIQPTSFCQ